ncbi:MAG: para-aminobenzoate synthetase/4-amino-4-deoxychorismate lyase, partial [Saprospiraceae bacterium]
MTNNIILRDYDAQQWLEFGSPKMVLTTKHLHEVLPILQRVESLIQEHQYYAAGFISYEASTAFDDALQTHKGDDFPLIWFGLYEKPTVFNFDKNVANNAFDLKWLPSISKKAYFEALEKVRHFIKIGDTYQVNFTMRQFAAAYFPPAPKEKSDAASEFDTTNNQKPFNQLKSNSPLRVGGQRTAFSLFQNIAQTAPYGAFINIDDFSICSASPELFFKVKNGEITASPMKGTASRGRTNAEDEFLKNQLYNSQKDRSENVMIVDMIRNDLSKIAAIGTVNTPKLFDIEKYPTVWQMTSRVEGKTTASLSELMTALFPCASITGAPKASTMRIISALENTPRRIYTGTIGFIKPDGDMQFNVAIRTALFDEKNGRVEYGTGGGITIKSETQKEYEEALLKTKIITQSTNSQSFKLLETILWSSKNEWFLLDKHLERLADAAAYFGYKIDLKKIEETLFKRAGRFEKIAQKVRLLVERNGTFIIENHELKGRNMNDVSDSPAGIGYGRKPVQIATQPVDSYDVFLFHKTTNREIYEQNLRQFPDAKDVILWNERGEITESCYGNVVIFDGESYWTPPVESGLLNGVFRQYLLEKGTIRERVILKEELEKMDAVFLV